MIIPEYEAKGFLKEYGLYIPLGEVAIIPEEAREIAAKLGGRVVVKALIPTGGRGKAGGVKLCETAQEVFDAAAHLLGKPLLGHIVERVLIEVAQEILYELYAGVIVNLSADGLTRWSAHGRYGHRASCQERFTRFCGWKRSPGDAQLPDAVAIERKKIPPT
jgi:succinyl-CoA synthetase beta subunit